MSRRESMHDAVRDFLEGFSDDTDARFNTVSTRDQVAVGPDDDLEQKVADNGGNTSYIISGTHRVNLDASYDNIALVGDPESRPTLVMGDDTDADDAWDPQGGSVVNCLGGQTDAQNDTDPVQGFYMRDLDIDGRGSEIGNTSGSEHSTIYIRHVEDIHIERCRIFDTRIRGINVHTTPNDSNKFCWITNNKITNNGLNATHISAQKSFVANNYAEHGDDTAYEMAQLDSIICTGNIARNFQTCAILTQITEKAIVSGNVFHAAGTGLSVNKSSGRDVNRPLIVGNVFRGDENADANLDSSYDPGRGISFDGTKSNISGNTIIHFNQAIDLQGGDGVLVSSNFFTNPRGGPMVNITESQRSVSNVHITGNYFNGDRGTDPSPDAISTGSMADACVENNWIENVGDGITVSGDSGYVSGNRVRTYNNAVVVEGSGTEVAFNHFRNGSNRGVYQNNGGASGLYHHNHIDSGPNNGVVIDSNSAEWWGNIGETTENTGTTTVSGDGTATTFNIGRHDLDNGPTNPADTRSNIIVHVSPVSADAVSAAPVSAHPIDSGGDGTFEDMEAVFASAPASGTDNVEVRWEARMAGVRGR